MGGLSKGPIPDPPCHPEPPNRGGGDPKSFPFELQTAGGLSEPALFVTMTTCVGETRFSRMWRCVGIDLRLENLFRCYKTENISGKNLSIYLLTNSQTYKTAKSILIQSSIKIIYKPEIATHIVLNSEPVCNRFNPSGF